MMMMMMMMMMTEVNLNLRNIKQAIWAKLCFMYRLTWRNTSTTSLKTFEICKSLFKEIYARGELNDSILTENPLPKNFMKVPPLDVFIRDTMKEECRNRALTMASVLEKVQAKTRDVFGPLSRVCTYLQEVTPSDHEDEDESIQIDLDILLTYIQKTVLILAQALHTMTYHRRFNALSIIIAQTEAKSILKKKADILGQKDCLLGKDFGNEFVKDTEAKTKVHNAVQRKKNGAKAQPQASATPPNALSREPFMSTRIQR